MKRLTLTLALLLPTPGCAHGLTATIDGVEKTAAGVGVVVDESTKIWEAGVEAKVAFCKAKGLDESASEAERKKCMGLLGQGDKAEPALEKLVQGYDMLAEALKLLKEGASDLRPFLEEAQNAVER